MKLDHVSALSLICCLVQGSPVAVTTTAAAAQPTIYLTGDSTMAKGGAGNGKTNGWGEYLANYVTIPVVNHAVAGRSARSYTNEGRFASLAKTVKSGDFVVIEFGHNDGGSPTSSSDNRRSDCPGTGATTCKSGLDGSTVYTFDHYITAAAKSFLAKGAIVIVSSQTPNNPWEGGTFSDVPSRFVADAKLAATTAGAGAYYVDHLAAVEAADKKLGSAAVNAFYPTDHTHTSPAGANVYAAAFAEAVQNTKDPLAAYLKANIPQVY